MTKANPKRRRRLFAENPNCSSCGVLMTDVQPERHESVPPNFAVLYHTINKFTREGVPTTELCCMKCATEKNQAKLSALGIDRIRAMSSHSKCTCAACGHTHYNV